MNILIREKNSYRGKILGRQKEDGPNNITSLRRLSSENKCVSSFVRLSTSLTLTSKPDAKHQWIPVIHTIADSISRFGEEEATYLSTYVENDMTPLVMRRNCIM